MKAMTNSKLFYLLFAAVLSCNINLSLGEPKDVLFLVDGSGSVKPANFNKLRVLLKSIVDTFSTDTNVALIQFSSRQLTKVEFNLNTFDDKEGIKKAIDDMIYQRKYTYTGYAMKLAREQVFNGRGGDRPDAENILLLFTDGEAADPHIARAQSSYLKSQGAHLISVGFGPKKSVAKFRDELEVMASTSDKDVFVQGADDLTRIARRVEQAGTPGLSGQSADQCATRPCQNGGVCTNTGESYTCTCENEYEGVHCEKKKGPCTLKPCKNRGECVETDANDDGFKCICDDKYFGKLCQKKKVVCRSRHADLLFILDGSRSIKTSEFTEMKKFVVELVNRFNISRTETRVSVIQFSDGASAEFYLYEYPIKKSLIGRINAITLQDGSKTDTHEALEMASREIFKHVTGGRSDKRNVIILLTDGQAHKPQRSIEAATALKDDDVSIITVGVGASEVEVKLQDFLKTIASSAKYAFNVRYSTLESIQNSVIKAACENLKDL